MNFRKSFDLLNVIHFEIADPNVIELGFSIYPPHEMSNGQLCYSINLHLLVVTIHLGILGDYKESV